MDYLQRHYQFVSVQDCIAAVNGRAELPSNALLLTFDDGYIEHFTTVFPILAARKIPGCFFPTAQCILENKVLAVNKIHFILAAVSDVDRLTREILAELNANRTHYNLESNEYYLTKLAHPNRFDPGEIIFVKRLLQRELPEQLRYRIVDKLFSKYVTEDETAFAMELYMTADQLKLMAQCGMDIGGHGYTHRWLNKLPPDEQTQEICQTVNFLQSLGIDTGNWVMCYPHSAYDDSLINILKQNHCQLGLTVKSGLAELTPQNAFELQRLDTTDFPMAANASPCRWTQMVLNKLSLQ